MPPPPPKGAKPLLLAFPADWDDLTDDQKHAAAGEMAEMLLSSLGLPDDPAGDDGGRTTSSD